MKRWCVIMIFSAAIFVFQPCKMFGQAQEIEQLLLNVEKLAELKKILQNMYDGYKILQEGYNKVKDVANGNYKLHQVFLDGLYLVSPEIKKYYKIADIIQIQIVLTKEYKSAYNNFRNSDMFNVDELEYISDVSQKLVKESTENLNSLLSVVTAGKLRMSDDERLTAIDKLFDEMNNKLSFLRHFNKSNHLLALQRLRESDELKHVRKLHGIE